MKVEVEGIEYGNFLAGSVEIRLDALSNTFSFDLAMPGGQALPFKGGDACRVYVGGDLVLTGFIEVVEVDYSPDSHTVTIAGRDKTGDLLDSNLDSMSDLRGGLTLKSVIEAAIKNIGSDIKVVDNVKPAPFSSAEDTASAESGDNAFQFIESFSRKRQVLLTSDKDGNIVIEKNTGKTAAGVVQHIIGAFDNNVIRSNFRYDTTGRFNVYKFASQMSFSVPGPITASDLAQVVDQSGEATDPGMKGRGRQLVLAAESPWASTFDESRAKWEADIRRARGLVYTATVPGFRVGMFEGELWQINRLYQVVDDYLGKTEPMLCNSITFSQDVDNGSTTELGFVDEKAYTLSLSKPSTSESAANVS